MGTRKGEEVHFKTSLHFNSAKFLSIHLVMDELARHVSEKFLWWMLDDIILVDDTI